MLFMLRVHLSERANTSNKEFYSVWRQEAEAAVAALKAGRHQGPVEGRGRA